MPAGIRRQHGSLLIGAAIGTGMAANFAMRGGADFLVALNAGRLRSMGEPSISSMLALNEANDFVRRFAASEILPRASVPVIFGASCLDPRQRIEDIAATVKRLGFSGLTNFPTATMLGGSLRRALEAAGLGFARELELLSLARRMELASIAYTHTVEEAEQAARVGVDIVNIGLGWNHGGAMGMVAETNIEEAAIYVDRVARAVKAVAPRTLCMVEGGPIVSPRHLEQLCRFTDIDGYIGGSTIDRVPLETAIEVVTAGFKTSAPVWRNRDDLPEDDANSIFPLHLVGRSELVGQARATFMRLATIDSPVLITAPSAIGATALAEALHGFGPRSGREPVSVNLGASTAQAQMLDMFGCIAGAMRGIEKTRLGWLEIANRSTLILRPGVGAAPEVTREVVDAVRRGRIRRIGSETTIAIDVRLIIAAGAGRAEGLERSDKGLIGFNLPALADRPEDLPPLIEILMQRLRGRLRRPGLRLDAAAHRIVLQHDWPGDVEQLEAAMETAALAAHDDTITPLELGAFSLRALSQPVTAFSSERDWILEGLRRNRFRRGDTADYLGVSRKTLYNKMRAYGLGGRRQAARAD